MTSQTREPRTPSFGMLKQFPSACDDPCLDLFQESSCCAEDSRRSGQGAWHDPADLYRRPERSTGHLSLQRLEQAGPRQSDSAADHNRLWIEDVDEGLFSRAP